MAVFIFSYLYFRLSFHFHVMLCHVNGLLTHCGRVTQIYVFNTVKIGTSASSP